MFNVLNKILFFVSRWLVNVQTTNHSLTKFAPLCILGERFHMNEKLL